MGLRVDRPANAGGDDLVVFVARSLDEARRAREALAAAGVAVDLPDAGLEAVFQGGAPSVPVRVAARDFVRALDAIEVALPRRDDDDHLESADPDLEGDDDVALRPRAGQPPARRDAPAAREPAAAAPARADEAPADEAPDPLSASGALVALATRSRARRLEGTALKVVGIAGASLLMPGVGLVTGAFALGCALWLLARARAQAPDTAALLRGRARLALGLALAALALQALGLHAWLSR